MKCLQPVSIVVAALASVASADTISVLGAGVFTVASGTPCSGSNVNVAGACPGAQPGLPFGSCCVSIPNRATVVMGCAPLQSTVDSCASVAARLSGKSNASTQVTTTNTPMEKPAESTTSPSDIPIVNPSTLLPTPLIDQAAGGGFTPKPTALTPTTDPIAMTDSPKVVMSDAGNPSKATLQDTTISNTNSILVVASIVGVVIAIIGGVFFVRKNYADRNLNQDKSPNTPVHPASMGGGAYAQTTPYDEGDFLTPKEDMVCL
ncbi:hypothetical protein H310_07175 [Aphanomyces invadans]|uniref:Uncharacterized protein n=1 Tax=Aphanomyces invadans TaxID=157072 RepID=A0A024U4Q9_9STRA|nr:hypothetical protein H310_07175 [Aphanomyces invadans]ETW00603.1 hypothetical protein H310_07175 [Aphanomyces invadans]|eukprot:XP_008870738.1 hypothetical protein H310_07175 [Aphanomyces invadans]